MHVPVWNPDAPRRVLLATDLSSRCDRALDRSALLARQWHAGLVVVTVVDADAGRHVDLSSARRRADASRKIKREIARTDADLTVEVVVREGDVGDQVADVAARTGSSLIVTGTARNELFGRLVLGTTVERLARSSRLPLLTVRNRVRGPYARIAVASDFSTSSRQALDTILGLLPQVQPLLFHAFDVPFLGLMDTQRDEVLAQAEADARAAAKEFLLNAGYPALPVVVAHGDPAACLRAHVQADDIDLIVIASHGRSAIYKVLIGSVAQRILETAPCDTLLVPEPRARAAQ